MHLSIVFIKSVKFLVNIIKKNPLKGIFMTYEQIMVELFEFSAPTYYKWKKHEKRKVFDLLEKYFTKEDLEEFLAVGKIQRYDEVENSKVDNYVRTSEIIKLLTKYKSDYLALALAKSLESDQVVSGTSKRLHKTKTKLDFLKELERILSDLSSEISKGEDTTFQSIIENFNEEIGFDFHRNDKSVVLYIITRYRVYNTLYDLDS